MTGRPSEWHVVIDVNSLCVPSYIEYFHNNVLYTFILLRLACMQIALARHLWKTVTYWRNYANKLRSRENVLGKLDTLLFSGTCGFKMITV